MQTILFEGDSITDKNRHRINEKHLGFGYVSLISSYLAGKNEDAVCINKAISGSTTKTLKKRWKTTALEIAPDTLSLLAGVNDMWRRYKYGKVTTPLQFYDNYNYLISSVLGKKPETRIILMTPFLMPIDEKQKSWQDDLDEKVYVVEEISKKYKTDLIKPQMTEEMTIDGVHLNLKGDIELAKLWIKNYYER